MTGIDRLRNLAGAWDAYGLGGTLGDVARQIERERACDADTIENVRLIVGRVIDDAAPACAHAVEGLCAALTEQAWSGCDRALYGEDGEECPGR